MNKRILIVLSEWGYWGEELVGPLEAFDAERFESTFMTPKGTKPRALPPSMDPSYVDPPLNRTVVTEEMARKVRELEQTDRLNNPRSLAEVLPEYPYWSVPDYLRKLEAYYQTIEHAQSDLDQYDALLIAGGSGAMVDLANNSRVHALILSFYNKDKPIGAICYGVTCLIFARDIIERRNIIWGKHITGHTKEDDYKDGTGFVGTDFNMGPAPYPLEYLIRDAVGPEGGYHGNFGKPTSVIVDYPFITGRTTNDSSLTGQKMVEVLNNGLRRYGW